MDGTFDLYSSQFLCASIGITPRQLRHWVQEGIVEPAQVEETGHQKRYSFDFLNMLEVSLVVALKQRALPLLQIKNAVCVLRRDYKKTQPLKDLTLFSDGKTFYVLDTSADVIFPQLRKGKTVFAVAIDELARELAKKLDLSIEHLFWAEEKPSTRETERYLIKIKL